MCELCPASQPVAAPLLADPCNGRIGSARGPLTLAVLCESVIEENQKLHEENKELNEKLATASGYCADFFNCRAADSAQLGALQQQQQRRQQ